MAGGEEKTILVEKRTSGQKDVNCRRKGVNKEGGETEWTRQWLGWRRAEARIKWHLNTKARGQKKGVFI